MTPRSYLYVPADQSDKLAKSRGSAADALILDLEDAVAAGSKETALAEAERRGSGVALDADGRLIDAAVARTAHEVVGRAR